MSFRRRVVLLAAGAVAAAIVIASVVVYVVTGNELHGRIDASLRQKLTPGLSQAVQIKTVNVGAGELAKLIREGKLPPGASAPIGFGQSVTRVSLPRGAAVTGEQPCARAVLRSIETAYAGKASGSLSSGETAPVRSPRCVAPVNRLVLPPPAPGSAAGYVQLFQANGQVLRSETRGLQLPVTAATRAVAAGRHNAFFSEATVAGTPMRILTKRAPEGGVWQVALPLSDVDNTLGHLKLVLALVCLGGIALAAALGLLVSRTALIPVRRLTGAAERVARTQDLGHRIQAGEDDELGRLARSFNTMLAALERSRLAQRQLVSDASHELRTPLTSVQANLDALVIGEELSAHERARILAAAQAQLRELTVLVGDLVDLSKTEIEEVEIEDVRLDLAAAGALQRARLHAPRCPIVLDAEPCLVRAAPARLDRAIANLLDNACKWNPPAPASGPVEVRVRDGAIEVRDHGPGISAADLPRVFDRFYRAPGARGRPGSGLGLAIVRQMAEAHGGSVHAANDPAGGARLTLELPPLRMTAAELASSKLDAAKVSSVI
ncbi:MAG TPA: HAMP domain-containing sensor histidine kinase [Polyangia bacterium]|jgi:two-component system sensor histidine kinase MprB|nr:HAMP domain-containing sensor histidine kinase [Polyangia bacterium]